MSTSPSTEQVYNVLWDYTDDLARQNNIPDEYYQEIFKSLTHTSSSIRDYVMNVMNHRSGYVYVARKMEGGWYKFKGALVASIEAPSFTDRSEKELQLPRLPTGSVIPRGAMPLGAVHMKAFISPVDSLAISDQARAVILGLIKDECKERKIAFAHSFIKADELDPVVSTNDGFAKIPVYPNAPDISDYFCVYPPKKWNEHWKR